MADERWEDMRASVGMIYDIDENKQWLQFYLSVRIDGMDYWATETLHPEDAYILYAPAYKFLWDHLVKRVEREIAKAKEGNELV